MQADDRDLRERFAAIRHEEETRAPAFRRPSPCVHVARRPHPRLAVAAACLALTIAAAAWLVIGSHPAVQPREQTTASLTSWKPATDFLLDTPGRDLLRQVPSFGGWPRSAVAQPSRQRHRRSTKPATPNEELP